MQYQRRHKEGNQDQEQANENNNAKKIITTTTIEQSTTEKKPSRITTKPINISTISNIKKESKKNEIIKKISYTKTEKQYKKIESPSIMEARPQNNKIYLASRYHNRKQEETSPLFKENISGIEDNEYNIHTLNARKSPDNISYGRNSIENEKQIKIKNYNQYSSNPLFDNHQFLDQDTYKTNTNESIKMNNSTFNTNIKSYRPPMIPQNKMSPIQHYDDGNSSYENKRYTEQRNRYGNYLTTNMNSNTNFENMNLNISNINNNNNIPQDGRNTFGRIRGRFLTDANSPSYNNERVNSQNSNRVSYKELKKIVKKFNKVYDPFKNEKGLLIKQSQVTLPGASDEVFNNRYRVLSKMNKLSNILLAKQKKFDEDNFSSRGNSWEPNTFERERSFSKTSTSKNKTVKNSKRLLLVSLAMVSSKGLNTEDRTILRKNRIGKGGVVDLAQEKIKKNKFKIKKASKISGGGKTIVKSNPKYREKAAKIIQAWWKELKDIYNYKLSQIIRIQSIWKGRWVRKNIYDLLYLNYLYLSFCEKIEKVFNYKMTRYAMDKLIAHQKKSQAIEQNKLKDIFLKTDKKRISTLRNYWEIWIKKLIEEKNKKNKGKNLIQIRADKENKLGKLRTAFTIWKYNTILENIKNKYDNKDNEDEKEEINVNGKKIIKITKISEKERYFSPGKNDNVIEKDKFKGLLHILDGVNKYHKKQAFDETKPKIINYLKSLSKEEKLKTIIENEDKKRNYIIKKTIYKWLTKTIKISSIYDKENEKENNDNFKAKMFLRRIENVNNKQKNRILRKYFYRYLKIVLLMGKKEERKKYLDMYKNDTNSYKNEYYNYDKERDKDSKFSLNPYVRKQRIKKIGLSNISDNLEGTRILERYMWRHTYENLLYCFMNKLDTEIVTEYMIKMVKIKEKVAQNILKIYFERWKSGCMLKRNDDLKSKLFIKIIKIIIDNNQKKLLSKKIYQWQKIVHLLNGKDNLFLKSKNTYNFIDYLKNFVIRKYGPSFLDELNQRKKENAYNQLLIKNIIKQDNKKNQMLLKNLFNKWKNKVADYEIGKLKGKLILKIYDKYNATKAKDVLGKTFTKWENNTIFLDKIKNRINKENIDAFTKMNNKDKMIILLKAIIRNINRKNNDAKLRKYLNIWKKNIQDRNKTLGAGGLYILKILRMNNTKYFLNKLSDNRKEKILKKLILNYSKLRKKDAIKEYFFRKWSYMTKILQQNENANYIQKFCLIKLRNLLIEKRWKKLSSLLKKKNKLNNVKDILRQLKTYLSIIKLIQALKGNNKDNIFDKKHMRYFFNRLNDLLNNLNNQNYSYLFLKRIINKQNNKKNNILLKNAINKWKNKIADYEIGKLKGKLLLKIYDKYKNGKIKEILKKTISKWENNTIFLDKIKNRINQENLDKFNTKSNKDKTIIIIKSIIRNINRKNNDIKLRKHFNNWKNNIQDRNKVLEKAITYIIKIIKNNQGKNIFKKLNDNKKYNILKKLVNRRGKPKKEILDSYFSRWKYLTKKTEQIENANIIQKYCLIKLRNRLIVKRWKKLYLLLKNQLRKNNIKDIINQLKKYLSIIKLIKALKGNNKDNIFDKKNMRYFFDRLNDLLNNLNNQNYSYLFLKRIINKQDNKKNNLLLKNSLNKWKNKVADYEIGRLKGKLIVKIYDKYNGAKIKDIIKKTISRWENNTIFLDKIKNRVNKENEDKFNKLNNKDKTLIILKSIIRNRNRKNNDTKVRKCFNDWKKNIQDRNKTLEPAILYIIKIIKLNNAKYFFDKLKDNKINDRENKLKKIINKNNISKDKILDSYLSKWRYITKRIEQEENAKIIQKFCEINLRKKEVIKKWKKLYSLLKDISRKNDIKDALNKLKKYLSIIKLIKALKGNNKNNIFDKKHMRNFFDKLNGIKKFYTSLNNLKIMIIKMDDFNKKNLLKNIIYKWRNIVAESEIERLKGKLLLKIYDKYKISKIKDILGKILRKWENRAIYLDNIQNKLDKENADKFNAKNKKDKIIIILKSIIRNLNRKNNDAKLRKYFKIWKKNIQDRNKTLGAAGLYILKIFRINNERNFFEKLKNNRKDNILKNLFAKYSKLRRNKDILDSYLSRWRYISKRLEQEENAKIIQKFCEINIRNREAIKKWKKLYLLLRDIYRKNNIKDALNQLKKYLSIIKLIKALKGNNKDNIFDKKHMRYFFGRLNDLLNNLNNKDYLYLILKKIILKNHNNNRHNLLKRAIAKWKNEVADYEIGRLKGKLLQKLYDKYKTSKIKETIKKVISKWENNTIFLDKIKDKIDRENKDKFSKLNQKDKTIIIIRSIIRNINRKNNEKLLRKYFNKWRKNINDKNKNINNGIDIIIKIIKLNKGKELLNNLKDIKRDDLLNKIINRNERPKDDILDAYFSRWRYINKKINQIDYAIIIQKFCQTKLFETKNRNRWRKLYLLLRNRHRKNNLKDILKLIKYYIGLNNLAKTLKKNVKRNIFDLLNNQKDTKKITNLLIEIFENLDLKNNENLLKKYFLKWKNIARKKNSKEEALDNMMKMLEIKNMKNTVNNLADASLINKLLNDIRKARALYFLRKLKREGRKNNLFNNLAKDLVDTNDYLLKENTKFIIDKIIKIYAYKVLSNLFDHLNKIQNYIIKTNSKDFLRRLYLINMTKRRKRYRKTTNYERNPVLRKGMKLHKNKKPSLKRDEKNNKLIVYRQLTPFLVKYLNRKFRDQKSDAFDAIKYNNVGLGDKFCKLLKIFSNKTQIPDKEDLVDSLKYYVYMKLTKATSSNKLYYLIRKAIIRKILNISKAAGNLNRLLHLINITVTHRKIAKDRWLLKLIKKWRFITFVKKMAMKKMELMYKDLHVTYLEMADSVLKDGNPLGPNGNNFLHDINKDKYLYDFYDPYLVKGAKPYKTIKKQIIFEPIDAEVEKRIKIIEEVKRVDRIKEINKSYYDKDDDSNKGKYNKKFTVLKTKKVEVNPKKTGKKKIMKYEKGERGSGKGESKTSFRYKGYDNQEDLKESRGSIQSGMKDSNKDDLSESVNSEIRDSIKNEIKNTKKNDFGIGFEFDDKNYGNYYGNYLKYRSENIKSDKNDNNNVNYYSVKSYNIKRNEKK